MNPIVAKFVSTILSSRTQAHIFHWQTQDDSSFAKHKALNEYYDEIVDLIDGLVESYQGKYGLIEFKPVNGIDNDCSAENILRYFDLLIKFLENERKAENLQDSWIQNQLDNVSELLYSTKYKLVNLQ